MRHAPDARSEANRAAAGLASVRAVPVIEVPVSRIVSGTRSTTSSASALGFPPFYGRNMDAWIDCLTYRDEDDGMASVVGLPGGMLTLQLDEGRAFAERCPEQYAALIECAAFVNWRRIETGGRSIITLSFH
jgi:barstar (barnase inhibitor)